MMVSPLRVHREPRRSRLSSYPQVYPPTINLDKLLINRPRRLDGADPRGQVRIMHLARALKHSYRHCRGSSISAATPFGKGFTSVGKQTREPGRRSAPPDSGLQRGIVTNALLSRDWREKRSRAPVDRKTDRPRLRSELLKPLVAQDQRRLRGTTARRCRCARRFALNPPDARQHVVQPSTRTAATLTVHCPTDEPP